MVKILQTKNKIDKDMALGEVVLKFPGSAEIMMKHGLHCVGCHVAVWETLEQGAMAHGMSKKELDDMLNELNKL